jgi:hypothetical protein
VIDTATPLLTTPEKAELYRTALDMLNRSGVPYMVGGTYAFQYYAGIARTTKDFDIFVRARDVHRVLGVLERAGFKTEITFSHWLAKAHHAGRFIDVIFSSGNAVAEVDDEWFAHAVDEEVLGAPVKLCPAEEMIWSKALIMERERYDGADVAHLFRHCSGIAELGAPGAAVRSELACAVEPLDPVWFHLSRRARAHPVIRYQGPSASSGRGAGRPDSRQQSLSGHVVVAAAVSGGRR